jgi:hypothetical protein
MGRRGEPKPKLGYKNNLKPKNALAKIGKWEEEESQNPS